MIALVIVSYFYLQCLMLLHSEKPKLYTILAFLSAIGLMLKWSNLTNEINCRVISYTEFMTKFSSHDGL